ncbi:MAG: hypothetical protein GY768_11080 [Planctomycetaceae bacterium]|nr:hypothetical protein [Planctomycetaceae bacterium]
MAASEAGSQPTQAGPGSNITAYVFDVRHQSRLTLQRLVGFHFEVLFRSDVTSTMNLLGDDAFTAID